MAIGDPPKTVVDFPKQLPKLPKLPAGGLRFVLLAALALWVAFSSFLVAWTNGKNNAS